jgi:hypothetical protein
MRRAVIIVNIVNLVLLVIVMIFVIIAHNEDNAKSESQKRLQDMNLGAFIAYAIIFMLFCVAGIVGAKKYNISLVGIAAVYYCVSFIFSSIQLYPVGMVSAILFVYPHFVFIHEVRKGIMSEENYHNEEQSCCCV